MRMEEMAEERMTISEAAERVGVCPKTLVRGEQGGKVPKSKRDWRGWRVYHETDVENLIRFREQLHD